MVLNPGEIVVMEGTFLYDGTVECDLRIVRNDVCHGSADYDDSTEIAQDQHR
ncbi:hypothetical protein [Massilia sp. TWR1-2-2]|uniref:hypothetical protein n=1 Tax=Massilia sp. TWR1-2-2 TaxID=2804584 RepID=UPI003CECB782